MACSRLKFLLATSLFAMSAVGFVGQAAGDVIGTNPFLDKKHGKVYIPGKPQAGLVQGGGVTDALGSKISPGKYVGAFSDTVKLSASGTPNDRSTGEVSVMLDFVTGSVSQTAARTAVEQEFHPMDPATAALVLTFSDMDFKETKTKSYTYSESLALYFLHDSEEQPGEVPDLVINSSNYLDFRQEGTGIETNKTKAKYTIGMAADLGLGNADFNEINETGHFVILAKFVSNLKNTSARAQTFRNSAESFSAIQTDVIGVPEPTSMAVIAVGSLVTLIRRKR